MDARAAPEDEAAPLVVDVSSCSSSSSDARPARNHARDVHILSLAFLLIFSAYGAAQNLESSVNTVIPFVPGLPPFFFLVSFCDLIEILLGLIWLGGRFGDNLVGDSVPVLHLLRGGGLSCGEGFGVKDGPRSRYQWLLAVHSLQFEALMVCILL